MNKPDVESRLTVFSADEGPLGGTYSISLSHPSFTFLSQAFSLGAQAFAAHPAKEPFRAAVRSHLSLRCLRSPVIQLSVKDRVPLRCPAPLRTSPLRSHAGPGPVQADFLRSVLTASRFLRPSVRTRENAARSGAERGENGSWIVVRAARQRSDHEESFECLFRQRDSGAERMIGRAAE